MRVATFNISSGFLVDEDRVPLHEDLSAFADQIREVDPDILCMQEVGMLEGMPDQAHLIAELLEGYHVRYQAMHENHVAKQGELGVAILSKMPLSDVTFHQLPDDGLHGRFELFGEVQDLVSHTKGLLEAQIEIDGHSVRVLSAHLPAFRRFDADPLEERFVHVREAIGEAVLKGAAIPTLFCGDMNYPEMEKMVPEVFTAGFQNVLSGKPTTMSGRAIDYIIASPDWKAGETDSVLKFGDHALCWVDLELA